MESKALLKFKEGDRVVTCGTAPGFHSNGNYYAPKVYQAHIRKKDKVLVWKLSYVAKDHEMAVPGWIATPAAIRLARAYARDHGLPFMKGIKNNEEVTVTVRRERVVRPKTTVKRKVPETGQVVEEPQMIGRFRKIDDDDIV